MTHAPFHVGGIVRDLVPPALVPAFVLVTHLGNPGFLLAVFTVDYWLGDHERGAHALALAIGGMAVVTALKAFFGVPRPPEEVNVIPTGGYSFPSGHAIAATIAYGILAFDLKVGPKSLRYGTAGVLVSLIALSRIVLGVHFVRDVVAGVAVGLVFLAAATTLTSHSPRSGFRLAFGLGVVAFLVSGGSHDGVAVLGATGSALLTWELLGTAPTVRTLRGMLVLVGAAVLAGVLASPLLVERSGL